MREANEFELVRESAEYLQSRIPYSPQAGIILGTGSGHSMDSWKIDLEIPIKKIPHLIPPHVISHAGKVLFATIENIPCIIFSGRVHYYEGHELTEVVRPVRLMKMLGCSHLILTNASGGINPDFAAGDIVIIRDHINLSQINPLNGHNESRWGLRFPEMKNAYDRKWREAVKLNSMVNGINVKDGVYAYVQGPSLETEAECEFLFRIGADLVGMSTIPEVITARHMDMNVLGISVVANASYPPERVGPITVEGIVEVVEGRAKDVARVIEQALKHIG
jgi:purine-nucleoside phosphorylase